MGITVYETEAPASDPGELSAPVVHAWATGRDVAEKFLLALEAGQVAPGMRSELAAFGAALGDRLCRLAVEVEDGGPFTWRRAIELAELLLVASTPARDDDSAAESG